MRIARFHVFSGTGNSRHLGARLAPRLEGAGFATETREVSAAEIHRLRAAGGDAIARAEGDLDLFIFPVYALALPRIMDRYMRSLGRPRISAGPRPRAAILCTNGRISARWRDGHEGQALAQAERVLGHFGWEVVYRDSFDYPQNVTTILPAQDGERRFAIMALVLPRIEEAAQRLACGRWTKRPCSALAHVLGWPFGWLYRLVGRRAWALLFAADASCDGCGLCAAACPAGAIRMRGGRPSWSYACEGCERCMNLCPREAIQTSLLRVAIMAAFCLWQGLSPLRGAGAAALPFLSAPLFEALWWTAGTIAGLGAFRLLALGLEGLSRIAFLRLLLSFGWTRWTRRYPGPGGEAE